MPSKLSPPKIQHQFVAEDGSLAHELPSYDKAWIKEIFEHVLRVRCVDQRMLKIQRAGRVGFVGSMLGQESAMIGTAAGLRAQDYMWSGLREGGAALMRGLPLSEYIAQMYCNSNDTARGRQMCNHFQHKASNYPSWSSVIGTQIGHAVGAAFAAKRRGLDEVHGVWFGDGATSSNPFHSGLNFAGVWKAPVVFVCVDNGWAISLPAAKQTAQTDYAKKALAYGIPGYTVDGNDVFACYEAMKSLVEYARDGGGASLLVVKTYRLMGHSSSDDPTKYRDAKEVAMWEKRDPLPRLTKFMESKGLLKKGEAKRIEKRIIAEIDAEIHVQEDAPGMPMRSLVEDVYADVPQHLQSQYNEFLRVSGRFGDAQPGDGAFPL